jgi:head-tail adaptor
MRIAKLDRYVRIEQKSVVKDPDYGSEEITWVTYKNAWASILDITTKMQESTNSDLRQLKQPTRVQMRYDATIDVTMRLVVVDTGRILNIVSQPAEIGRREAIEFMAENYER